MGVTIRRCGYTILYGLGEVAHVMENTVANVKSKVFGRGAVQNIASDVGTFTVCTMEIPWKLTKELIGATPLAVVMVNSMEESVIESQLATVPECDTFIGIGGGQAVDLAKYFSWKRKKRLVTIPTVLSVDAFVTPGAGIRRGSEVVYVGETSPDPLVIDHDIIRTAPVELNIAGIGDLLSIHTATFDWEYAQKQGRSEYPFSADAIAKARAILANVMSKTHDIANVTDDGINAIVRGYMAVNSICIPAGHYRVEEGSEHYLFYAMEKKYQRSFIHGHIIGLGIYIMSRLQQNKWEEITKFMDTVGLHYHPEHMGLTREGVKEVLLNLKAFVSSRRELWFTIINGTEFSEEILDRITEGLFNN